MRRKATLSTYSQHVSNLRLLALLSLSSDFCYQPIVQHLPKWLPGMKFKRDAARWKEEIQDGLGAVFELVRENTVRAGVEVVMVDR